MIGQADPDHQPEPALLLNRYQLADKLGVSVRHVERLCSLGKISSIDLAATGSQRQCLRFDWDTVMHELSHGISHL